ncbi:Cytochrome c oxidase subunit 6A1, mitochondrial [Atta colombica]|uniref:Cytochrome c oxidase subunit n=1 Tax=Atta colombica TaxID=520822 RepID=A0A195BSD4_9HYME|nr:Cytochrome c oxidase subunit 6A1, mitochondrial [Atta colombica]
MVEKELTAESMGEFKTAKRLGMFTERLNMIEQFDAQLLWKRLSYFVGFPAIGLAMVNCYLSHQAHHDDERPEFVAYEHLRIRTKKYPWGDGNHSLFHNSKMNPLPEGYEE